MNRQGVQLDSPFEYIKEQEQRAKKILDEQRQSESARYQAQESEIQS